MVEVRHGRNVLILHDGPDTMTIDRFHKFQYYGLIDANIGTDLEGLANHYHRMMMFAKNERIGDLIDEINNLKQSIFNIQNCADPSLLSFSVLVDSINGVKTSFVTDLDITDTSDKIKELGFTQEVIKSNLTEVKKKLNQP